MPYTNKNVKTAYDFTGVVSLGLLPKKGDVIITGKPKEDEQEILDTLEVKIPMYFYEGQDELTDENRDIKIGAFKAAMIKKLGIEKYYEDTPAQVTLLKELTKAEIVQVTDGIAEEPMKFICFTYDGSILPVAKKLMDEGNDIMIGMIENSKNIFTQEQLDNGAWKREPSDKMEERFKLYDGVLEKETAERLLKKMKGIKNKEEWFILADSNNCFRFCQDAYDMGFTNGYFPTEEDRDFEENRTKAKDFVKEHYEGIEIGMVQKFEDIETAKEFLATTDKMWVLKSQGDTGDTVLPKTEELEQATEQIISALEAHQSEYEQDGFILEELLPEPLELTPQVIFYNGNPVYYSLDIENKPMGAGNIGTQLGCAQNLVCHTKRDDYLNKLAFPEVVYEMAKNHKGMFIWDCSILVSKNTYYFGEFCSNRFGWDSFPTELSMCQSLTLYFKKVMLGIDPLTKQYGAGVRVLNLGKNGEVLKDASIQMSDEKDVWIYDCYDKKGLKAGGAMWDFALITGCGDDVYEAVCEAYENCEKVTLETKYLRPKFDFLSWDYSSSILNRKSYAVERGLIQEHYDAENTETVKAGIGSYPKGASPDVPANY